MGVGTTIAGCAFRRVLADGMQAVAGVGYPGSGVGRARYGGSGGDG